MIGKNKSQQETQQLLRECCYIIEQQQQHIAKLQSDLLRKQTIIANLLSKKESIRTKKQNILREQDRSFEVQKLTQQIYELRSKYENSVFQIQAYELQITNKNKEIADLCRRCQILQCRDKQIQEQAQEGKQVMARLKQVYQAKISMLLTELKKYVQDDVKKVQQRLQITHRGQRQHTSNSNNNQIDQNQVIKNFKEASNQVHFSRSQKLNEQAHRMSTPIKVNILQGNLSNQKQNTAKPFLMSTAIPSERKLLENTPYKNCSNFMAVRSKQFPQYINQTSSNKKVSSNNKIKRQFIEEKRSARMLWHDRDAKYITDSYEDEDEYEESYSSQSSHRVRPEPIQNNKISIQKVIEQFSKYYTNYEVEREFPQSIKPQNQQKSQSKKSILKQMKITKILDTLSDKIKRFQNQNIGEL